MNPAVMTSVVDYSVGEIGNKCDVTSAEKLGNKASVKVHNAFDNVHTIDEVSNSSFEKIFVLESDSTETITKKEISLGDSAVEAYEEFNSSVVFISKLKIKSDSNDFDENVKNYKVSLEENESDLVLDRAEHRSCALNNNEEALSLSNEMSFKCPVCGKHFPRKSGLENHIVVHTGAKNFKCKLCGSKFSRKSSLVRHNFIHTGEKNYGCIKCGKAFSRKFHLREHMRIHTGQKDFMCEVCGKAFTTKTHLKTHMTTHIEDNTGIFKCSKCKKGFSVKSELDRHMQIHEPEKKFRCDVCDKYFSRSYMLTKHRLIHSGNSAIEACEEINSSLVFIGKHKKLSASKCVDEIIKGDKASRGKNEKDLILDKAEHHIRVLNSPEDTLSLSNKLKCPICGKQFSRKDSVENHLVVHTGVKNFRCNICECKFSQKSSLVRHNLVHTGEKNYGCVKCGKAFSRKSHLHDHMLIHTRQKNFICELCGKVFEMQIHLTTHLENNACIFKHMCSICGKGFLMPSGLDRHMQIHKPEKKNFKCELCGRGFTQKISVRRHMMTHTGTKNFTCDICGADFSLKGNLISHKRIHITDMYECDVCKKKFSQNAYLKRHMVLHKGKKDVKCKICLKEFFQQAGLRAHMKRYHLMAANCETIFLNDAVPPSCAVETVSAINYTPDSKCKKTCSSVL